MCTQLDIKGASDRRYDTLQAFGVPSVCTVCCIIIKLFTITHLFSF